VTQGLLAVTGGTGLIGRSLVDRARSAGFRLRILTRRPEAELPDGCESCRYDLADAKPVDPGLFDGCSAVVHLAAFIPADQASPAEAERCLDANALGTLRLVEAMAQAGVTRLVQTTAANSYAPGHPRPTEDWPVFPAQRAPFYLGSKMLQEVFAHQAASRGLEVTSLRPSSVYGPGASRGAIGLFARSLLAGQPIRLADGGRFAADFVTADDVAAAILLALEAPLTGIYNVGSGVRATLAEVAEILIGLTRADHSLVALDPPTGEADPGFPAPDISRIAAAGFRPTPLAEGLRSVVEAARAEERRR
jgi:UDP-glucose 4-epimerase